ncbi:MAG TPA: TIGR03960 family B12-binding radical SAM protein [Ruminococcaceae bacterium]|nr:TIGR03960 family B12-binding radical SAM protein [Oscillospiraceae bacterium]
MLSKKVEDILLSVQKPGRYTGGELNSVMKDKEKIDIRYAFCFPDTYEVGMSHLGIKILYSLVNAREDAWCERVFAPWADMEEKMRENDIKLYALESGDEIRDFDLIGFTLQYEMSYTAVLNMLDLAGIPLHSCERTELTPLVIAGGPCVCNAEPMADFIDIMLPGEGEEVTNDLIDLLKEHKKKGSTKQEFLRAAAQIQGVYVPSLYDVTYNEDGTVQGITAKEGAPARVKKRIVADLDTVFFPCDFIVPSIEIIHDRAVAEVFRGCIRGCRFCQAGYIYRPIREKHAEVINRDCQNICRSTGYDEVSLCSLSTSDYTELEPLLNSLLDWTEKERVNVALPSQRADRFSAELTERLSKVRRSGLTFAPEAGTQRMRDVINKNITEEEILRACRQAFDGGWTSVKLYFMLGLPTETDEDVVAIAQMAQRVVDEFYHNPNKPKGKSVSVNISVAPFVPKPFTPFQWEAQNTKEELLRKQQLLISSFTSKKISLSRHDTDVSFLEGVLARGDRRLSAVIENAYRKGCKLDSWSEFFNVDTWLESFAECGIDPAFYANRERSTEEVLPWDHLDYGVTKTHLVREHTKAHDGTTTPHCRIRCAGCGANKLNGGECDALNKSHACQKGQG